jgi:ATP/ADP translocase
MESNTNDDKGAREAKWATEIENENDKSNFLGSALFWIGAIIFFCALIATLFYSTSWLTTSIYGLLIAGLGEVIALLQKIYFNTKGLNRGYYLELSKRQAEEEAHLESAKMRNLI